MPLVRRDCVVPGGVHAFGALMGPFDQPWVENANDPTRQPEGPSTWTYAWGNESGVPFAFCTSNDKLATVAPLDGVIAIE
jgi:hypothetical protein